MKGLVFDIRGSIGHFRRPDTTATQMTYPFITPTAAKGLVGAILGIEDFVTIDKVGIKLLNPVQTVAQQMSMLGKDSASTFNRPTTLELLVNPAYRIYYTGEEYTERLLEFLAQDKSVYTTYLGVAYALTKPVLYEVYSNVSYIQIEECEITLNSVVPIQIIKKLIPGVNHYYCRAGGYLYQYKGNRTFEKSVDFLYEKNGKSITIIPKKEPMLGLEVAKFGEELICMI
jgi:CRISPR-associated protein Cas5h